MLQVLSRLTRLLKYRYYGTLFDALYHHLRNPLWHADTPNSRTHFTFSHFHLCFNVKLWLQLAWISRLALARTRLPLG